MCAILVVEFYSIYLSQHKGTGVLVCCIKLDLILLVFNLPQSQQRYRKSLCVSTRLD